MKLGANIKAYFRAKGCLDESGKGFVAGHALFMGDR